MIHKDYESSTSKRSGQQINDEDVESKVIDRSIIDDWFKDAEEQEMILVQSGRSSYFFI